MPWFYFELKAFLSATACYHITTDQTLSLHFIVNFCVFFMIILVSKKNTFISFHDKLFMSQQIYRAKLLYTPLSYDPHPDGLRRNT